MSCIRTTTVETEEQQLEARARRLDAQFDWLQAFVSAHGPLLLTRGMEVEQANEAVIACLKRLHYGMCREIGDPDRCADCEEMIHAPD